LLLIAVVSNQKYKLAAIKTYITAKQRNTNRHIWNQKTNKIKGLAKQRKNTSLSDTKSEAITTKCLQSTF